MSMNLQIQLYETSQTYYLIGCDDRETRFRVLKIDRRVLNPQYLSQILTEDPGVYTKEEIHEMLTMVHGGHKATGGMKNVGMFFGLVGFVKFLDCYYFTLISQRKLVGRIGANNIYAIKSTEFITVKPSDEPEEGMISKFWRKANKKFNPTGTDQAESRYVSTFQMMDMTKDFYFSYTYDLTHSLQHNFVMSRKKSYPPPPTQEMFEWNHYLTKDLRSILSPPALGNWVQPIIYGFFQQKRYWLFQLFLSVEF